MTSAAADLSTGSLSRVSSHARSRRPATKSIPSTRAWSGTSCWTAPQSTTTGTTRSGLTLLRCRAPRSAASRVRARPSALMRTRRAACAMSRVSRGLVAPLGVDGDQSATTSYHEVVEIASLQVDAVHPAPDQAFPFGALELASGCCPRPKPREGAKWPRGRGRETPSAGCGGRSPRSPPGPRPSSHHVNGVGVRMIVKRTVSAATRAITKTVPATTSRRLRRAHRSEPGTPYPAGVRLIPSHARPSLIA